MAGQYVYVEMPSDPFHLRCLNFALLLLNFRLMIDERVFPVEVRLILAKIVWNMELELVDSKGSTSSNQEAYLLSFSVFSTRFTRWAGHASKPGRRADVCLYLPRNLRVPLRTQCMPRYYSKVLAYDQKMRSQYFQTTHFHGVYTND